MAIYTAGYAGRDPRAIVLAARELDALVLDIRHTPHSKQPGWGQKELKAALDSRYMHVPQLGNMNHSTGGGVELQSASEGVGIVRRLAMVRNLILLCGCRELANCHRYDVSRLLAMRGLQTSELAWPLVPILDLDLYPDHVISIQQPWAWLVVNGYKDVENRSWPTHFRGRILVHAGLKVDTRGHLEVCQRFWDVAQGMPKLGDLDRGGIVGVTTIADCVQEHNSRWYTGEWAWVMQDAQPLDFRPLQGALKIFSARTQLAVMEAKTGSSRRAMPARSMPVRSAPVQPPAAVGSLF